MIALTNPTSSQLKSWHIGTCASGSFKLKYGSLLYVDMRAWVAKLMMCARQLYDVINNPNWTLVKTYLIFLFANCISFQLQASTAQPVPASWRNCSMHYHTVHDQSVSINKLAQCHLLCQPAYLVFDANPLEDFEEGLTQSHAIVCIVKTCEAKKSTFSFPLRRC